MRLQRFYVMVGIYSKQIDTDENEATLKRRLHGI